MMAWHSKPTNLGLSWWSCGQDSRLPMQGAPVQSHWGTMPHDRAKKVNPLTPKTGFSADYQVSRHPDEASSSEQSQLIDRHGGTTPLLGVQPISGVSIPVYSLLTTCFSRGSTRSSCLHGGTPHAQFSGQLVWHVDQAYKCQVCGPGRQGRPFAVKNEHQIFERDFL